MNMRWGPVKVEAVRGYCSEIRGQSVLSYYLPNIRFHSRWKELSKKDFFADEFIPADNRMGVCRRIPRFQLPEI